VKDVTLFHEELVKNCMQAVRVSHIAISRIGSLNSRDLWASTGCAPIVNPPEEMQEIMEMHEMIGYVEDKTKAMQHPNSVPDVQQSQPSPESIPPNPICTTLSNWRWREMVTAAIIVVDFFFLYSTISLIGVFFPAEVSKY
jgi:hypothetical protein